MLFHSTDTSSALQVKDIEPERVAAAKGVKVAQVLGEGRGYFKLVDGSSHHSLIAKNDTQVQRLPAQAQAPSPPLPPTPSPSPFHSPLPARCSVQLHVELPAKNAQAPRDMWTAIRDLQQKGHWQDINTALFKSQQCLHELTSCCLVC